MEAVLKKEIRYTYKDYCSWPDGERWELIDGVAYAKAAPTLGHHSVTKKIFRQLDAFLHGKPCEAFFAPVAVRLNAYAKDDEVVEPDVFVVCDETKLKDGKCVVGTPDFIVEVLSPSTSDYDRITKLDLYQRSRVREYWIADPSSKTVTAHVLHDNIGYVIRTYDESATAAPVEALEGCAINLAAVFEGL